MTSGSASASLPLDVGGNHVFIRVTARDGLTTETFLITVARDEPIPSDGSTSSDTGLSAGTVAPIASIESPVTAALTGDETEDTSFEAAIEVANGVKMIVSVIVPVGVISGSATISISPAAAGKEVSSGVVAIRVTAMDSSGVAIKQFDKPLSINLGHVAASAIPMFSEDGIAWTPIQLLANTTLPDGVQEGYYIAADGRTVILTRHLTYFGVKKMQSILVVTPRVIDLKAGGRTRVVTTGGSGNGRRGFVTNTPTVCKVSSGGLLTGLSAGVCRIQATKAGNGTYFEALSTETSITIQKTVQRTLWLTVGVFPLRVGERATITTYGGSGDGGKTFTTTTPSVCSVSAAGVVTAVSAGICTVTATKAGDNKYMDASSQPVSLVVRKRV